MSGAALPSAPLPPEVRIEVCTCGCVARDDGATTHPDWPLAQAWAWLTRPVEPAAAPGDDGEAEAGLETDLEVDDWLDDDLGNEDDEDPDPASLPWWDARSTAARRRAVLPLVLLGEVQAGVLMRAVWEVAQNGSGPVA